MSVAHTWIKFRPDGEKVRDFVQFLANPALYSAICRQVMQEEYQDCHVRAECSSRLGSHVRVRFPKPGERDCSRSQLCSSCDFSLSIGQLLNVNEPSSALFAMPNSHLLVRQFEFSRVWLDAKDRKMLVLTPKKHVERLDSLDDHLWEMIFREIGLVAQELNEGIERVVVNQGCCQNHPHLHWKFYLTQRCFDAFLKGLSKDELSHREEVRKAVGEARRHNWLGKK